MFPKGKRILQAVAQFKSRKWPGKDIELLADKVTDFYQERSEIISGGVVTEGTGTDDNELKMDMSTLNSVLNGRIMAAVAALNDSDLFATAGSVGQAIYQSGATAAAIALGTSYPERAYITLIAANSDGAGAAQAADNAAPLLIAVVAGTAGAANRGTAHLTSQQVQDALDASTDVHDGVTGWAHVCQIVWSRTAVATYTVAVVMNRNNVPQGA